MSKITKYASECAYAIHPLGLGLPLCTFGKATAHELAEVKLQDFPVCEKKRCRRCLDQLSSSVNTLGDKNGTDKSIFPQFNLPES